MHTEKILKPLIFIVFSFLIFSLTTGYVSAVNLPPNMTNEFPGDGTVDIELNPTLTADIIDAEGDSVSWIVYLYDGETPWTEIDSGTASDGIASISVLTTTVSQYDYDYSWKIIAADPSGSGQSTEKSYTFTTKDNPNTNYPPYVRDPRPTNKSTDVPLNPNLQASIKDSEGDLFIWTLELQNNNKWEEIASGNAYSGEAIIDEPTTTITDFDTEYKWRITTTTESLIPKQTTEALFTFRTKPQNYKPTIKNMVPEDQAMDVPLEPILTADISDVENDPYNWTIELFDGNNWQILGSGINVTGDTSVSAIAQLVQNYGISYTWRVTATDPFGTNTVENTFTSRHNNYAPTISSPTPSDGQLAVSISDPYPPFEVLGTPISAYIEDKDNQTLTVTFSWLNPGSDQWEVLDTQTSLTKTFRTRNGADKFITPLTTYRWKIHAVDSTGASVEQEYSFTTGGLLTFNFRTEVGNEGGDQIMPVMGDIDNDGTQEIVMVAGEQIVVVDGKTGLEEWRMPGATFAAAELADLDNDGTPEILHAAYDNGPRVRALKGDGTVIWTTQVLSGEGSSLFPLLAYDIDGNGYPTIYFATEDQTPFVWDGTISSYTGAVTMIDHNGNVLKDTWLFHPCWGGMSLADANNDGKFELYVSDRRAAGYLDGNTSLGPHAYDAETLDLLWWRKDVQHSSPIPIVADVVGDEDLEVVLTPIVFKGPIVVDGMTGTTLSGMDYSDNDLPTHGVATVYDIDGDSNKEIVMATSYPANAPPEFAVFDLITGETEFRPALDYQVAWAPKVGDVGRDSRMEILVATGPQGWSIDKFPLLVYGYDPVLKNYTLIDRVDPNFAGQLMPARVYDTDSDGYNEVVVAGYDGWLYVYDTPAETPNPAPRTWVQMYSEYRQGAAAYVPPPGAPQPIIKETNIADKAINIQPNATLSARIVDFHKDKMEIVMEISEDDGNHWITTASYSNADNGWYNTTLPGLQLNKTYSWRITASDPGADNKITTSIISFTTSPCDKGLIQVTYYIDSDNDQYGDNANPIYLCALPSSIPPAGYSLNNTDCNDANASVNPAALEICDGIDNNCNGLIDEVDTDNDGISDCHPDNCPLVFNPGQEDTNNNSIGDACDCGDGVLSAEEMCDGTDFGGKTCQSFSFDTGVLKCTASCTFDTSSCSYNSNSGGSSGSSRKRSSSGGSYSTATNGFKSWTDVSAGQVLSYEMVPHYNYLSKVDFRAIKAMPYVSIMITAYSSPPEEYMPVAEVFRYFRVKAINISETDYNNVKFSFSVPKSWVSNQGILKEDVTFAIYNSDGWEAVETGFISEDSTVFYYEAKSSSFGYFAIMTKNETRAMVQDSSGTGDSLSESSLSLGTLDNEAEQGNLTSSSGAGITGRVIESVSSGKSGWLLRLFAFVVLGAMLIAIYYLSNKGKQDKGNQAYFFK
ncbi:PGF-pre-PGF domain-containing protein [Candidatus Woesearchaeota archaeon]|nr:PGF-pre-PGF domain-containing protein [Candidatus Woesearchaeota archaeon]